MKLSTLKELLYLIENKEINKSQFKSKQILDELESEAIVLIKRISTSRSKILLRDKNDLKLFLKTQYNIDNLEEYLKIKDTKDISREKLVKVSSNSKEKKTNVQGGLYINCIDLIKIKIDNEILILNNIPNGSIFLNHLSKIDIPNNILFVIVENFENILKIKKQANLFKKYKKDMIFVFRNKYIYDLLDKIENQCLYFGDIDLAGISIYKNELKPKIKSKVEFFIPLDIENLLIKSKSNLYFNQFDKFKNLNSDELEISNLIKLIHKYKSTIEQEYLISM